MAKGRESGMPEEAYWNSFFDGKSLLTALGCDATTSDLIEFGCGYGTFTLPAARRVSGLVHAIDIDPEMIACTSKRASEAGLQNIRPIQHDFVTDGCGQPDASCDFALLFNILHIETPLTLLREAFRVLTPGGKCGIIHWKYDPNTPRGPSMEIRPRPAQLRQWAEQAGFEFVSAPELPGCPHHHGILVQRPSLVPNA